MGELPSRISAKRIARRSTLFRCIATVEIGIACAVSAQAQTASDVGNAPTREAFLASQDVRAGLLFLRRLLWETGRADVAESKLEAPCWEAAGALARTEPKALDAQVDACLNAAAKAVEPEAAFVRAGKLISARGEAGVGMVVNVDADGLLQAVDVVPESPAALAGLQPGDLITAIDGQSVKGLTLSQSISRIRGDAGTTVRLALVPAASGLTASARELVVTRGGFNTPSIFTAPLSGALYVQVRNFGSDPGGKEVPDQFLAALRQASAQPQRYDTVVLDLRGNIGGIAKSVVNFANMWGDKPLPGLMAFNANSITQEYSQQHYRETKELQGKEIVVLVANSTSAGAEWLTETLKRQYNALVVGRKTAGALEVRRGYFVEGLEGARFELPESEIFVRDGSLISGQGVSPDVVLDDARMKPALMGRAPEWLQAWLDKELPPARLQREKLRRNGPTRWHGRTLPSDTHLCSGLGVLPLPSGLNGLQTRAASAWVRTASRELTIGTSNNAEDFSLPLVRQYWTEQVSRHSAWLKRLHEKPAEETRTDIPATQQRLAAAQASLAQARSWPMGNPGVELVRGGKEYWLRWPQGRLVYRISLDGQAATMSEASVVAAYTALAASLKALPGHAAPPARPGVCLGDVFLSIAEPIAEVLSWTQWADDRKDLGHSVTLATRYVASISAVKYHPTVLSTVASKDDEWLLDHRASACSTPTWPKLEATTLAGLEAITGRTESDGPAGGRCRMVNTVSRLPLAHQPGLVLRVGARLSSGSVAELDATEGQWRRALGEFSVLPFPNP